MACARFREECVEHAKTMMMGLAKRLVDGELDVKDLYGARDVCMKEYKVALNFMWIPPGPRNLKTQQINWLRDRVHFLLSRALLQIPPPPLPNRGATRFP